MTVVSAQLNEDEECKGEQRMFVCLLAVFFVSQLIANHLRVREQCQDVGQENNQHNERQLSATLIYFNR